MTQEDKQLLIKDLSARVFYGVKVNIERDYPNNPQVVERVAKDGEIIVNGIFAYDIYYYKPYLRPLSSMTEEENEELKYVIDLGLQALEGEEGHNTVSAAPAAFEVDFYNKHHFDYRGLIEKGLALEAPDGMYKTE